MKIFLSQSGTGSYNAIRWIFSLMGILFLLSASERLYGNDRYSNFVLVFSVVQILFAIGVLIYSLILLSPKSKYAPRFEFNDNNILIRKDVLSSQRNVNLADVKKVKYGSYEVSFISKEGVSSTFPIYTKNFQNSIAIKEKITARAGELGIEVLGG